MRQKLLIGLMAFALVASYVVIDSFDFFSGDIEADQTMTQAKIVEVNGEGTITVKPDIAYINIGVRSSDIDAKVAQNQNKTDMEKVMSALKELGIKEEDIATEQYNIWKGIDYRGESEVEKFNVVNTVKVTVRDISQVGQVIDAVAEAGANDVDSIRFAVTDEKKHYNEALKIAMENAEQKATSIMSTFGDKPGKPYKVAEVSYGGGMFKTANMSYDGMAMNESRMQTPIQTGELEIKANVQVQYDY